MSKQRDGFVSHFSEASGLHDVVVKQGCTTVCERSYCTTKTAKYNYITTNLNSFATFQNRNILCTVFVGQPTRFGRPFLVQGGTC